MALNLSPMQYVPLRHGSMRSDYLLPGRREAPFQPRIQSIDVSKNYMLKRDVLPNLASLSIRSDSPVPRSSDSNSSGSENNSPQKQGSVNSTRYKTEMCRPFEEQGFCKYGEKCQFSHGIHELRNLARHPKYKTELCRTYHTVGFCPYGPRCHFVHNDEDVRVSNKPPKQTKSPSASVDSAVRSLFSSWEYSSYPGSGSGSGSVHQLSVSLGSSGDYSPPSSLSTSPVLSPTFSDDIPSPLPHHGHHQQIGPVWHPLQATQDQFIQHSTILCDTTTYESANVHNVHRALLQDFRAAAAVRKHAARLEAMIPEHQQSTLSAAASTSYSSDHCISSDDYSHGANPQNDDNCPESPLRLPIFRRISVEEQAAARTINRV